MNYGALDLFVAHKLCKHKYMQDTWQASGTKEPALAFSLKQSVCLRQRVLAVCWCVLWC